MKKSEPKMPSLSVPAGMSRHPLVNTWYAMVGRCFNCKHPKYEMYGKRGVTVCPRWIEQEPTGQGFLNFLADVSPRPEGKTERGMPAFTLDRRDNDGPYSPSNCYWATARQQNRNHRYRRGGVLQPLETPPKPRRAYIVVKDGSVLVDDKGKPLVYKDLVQAKHAARFNQGHHLDLRSFLTMYPGEKKLVNTP